MNDLTESEIAWLAGLYEGEGNCHIGKGRLITVSIRMTDFDIIDRLAILTGVGQLLGPYDNNRKDRGPCKPIKRWNANGGDAVDFLEVIRPWLGQRRGERADQAIHNWKTNRGRADSRDTHCIHGHEYTEETVYTYKDGGRGCRICRREAGRKYYWTQKQKAMEPPVYP